MSRVPFRMISLRAASYRNGELGLRNGVLPGTGVHPGGKSRRRIPLETEVGRSNWRPRSPEGTIRSRNPLYKCCAF
jgi:hypothetical protein